MDLGGLTATDLGAPALLALVVLMILRGWLVPIATVRRIEALRDQAMAEKDSHIATLTTDNAYLRDSGKATDGVMHALERVVTERADGGQPT